MRCHYCGKEVWLVRHLLDGDFCSPAHRKKYNERLRRSLESLPRQEGPPGPVAGFQFSMPPADSSALRICRSSGFVSSRSGPFEPKYSVELTPLFGQTFFGPNLAPGAAPQGVHATIALESLIAPPKTGTLQQTWALAAGAVSAARQPMPLGALTAEPGAPAIPICVAPAVLETKLHPLVCPKLALATLFTDSQHGDTSTQVSKGPSADLRRAALASWTRVVLEPVRNAVRVFGAAQPLESAAAPILTRNGSCLRMTPCSPATFLSPLLAADTVANGNLAPAAGHASTSDRPTAVELPTVRSGVRPQLPLEPNAIWKVQAASPWNLVQASEPERLPSATSATMLPAMSLSPVRPGLVAEWETRSLGAGPLEIPAAASHAVRDTIDSRERPAVGPSIAVPPVPVVIPQAVKPQPVSADVVSPQEHTAAPVAVPEIPMAAALSALGPSLETFAAAQAANRLRAAGPIPPALPAFIPQAAVPRYVGELMSRPCRGNTAIPAGTAQGFAWKPFAAVAPPPSERSLKPIAPAPLTVAWQRMAFRDPVTPVAEIGLPAVSANIPLDVYVQRVRSTPRRECAWRPVPAAAVVQPTAMPGPQPARFEQLVLQDWRRRYPARQIALTPAPISPGRSVLPITRRLSALSRFQRNAGHIFKATAAALVVGAILWVGVNSKGVRSTIVVDRQWLKTAITKRATLVLDDNFHSGLNLWEGRKNWARSWSYSTDGFIRTGQLALYRPTLKMDNYKLEFFAQIENKSVGWVFRAKDEQNYYAMKLSVTEPGPRPLVSVVRYPVLAGKKGKKVQIPLPIMMHNNTPYHVALDVKGTRYRAYIEDQEVDSWNDETLRAGGVGFFSENGEHARLYWVKVSNNTDWLGRLCGMLSGGGKGQNEAGLWNPADPQGTMAALDLSTALDGGKNADRKRGAPMLPFAVIFKNSF